MIEHFNKLRSQISFEFELLALLSLPHLSDLQIERVRSILSIGIDSPRFSRDLDWHRVTPCVYHNVQNHTQGLFPAELLGPLEVKYKKSLVGCKKQLATYLSCRAAFKKAGVAIAPLKGIPIALKLYGDIAKRTAKDIDFIVDPIDLDKADSILNQLGYKCSLLDDAPLHIRDFVISTQKDLIYKKPKHCPIELHHRVCTSHSKLSINHSVARLCKQDESLFSASEFCYLCWHGSNTQFHRLKWLVDIALYLDPAIVGPALSVDDCIHEAQDSGTMRSLLLSCVLAHVIYQTPLASPILALYRKDRVAQYLVRKSLSNINCERDEATLSFKIEQLFLLLLLETSWRVKIRIAVSRLRPYSADVMSAKKASPLFLMLFPLLKPVILVCRRIKLSWARSQ